ncbi:Vps62-related protein [Archangium violaceum]|uniref:Vps62-related protein n=1 Tax=Archangium violaceum TaxID=83451 RepID=UPI00193AEA15|nr:Vps62-related protein [Archangium violaceum]QRK06239.1 Vps62-related protein [Archangium violaceum]
MMDKRHAPKIIRLTTQGEPSLIISTTGTYNWICSDVGSGATLDVTLFRPNPDDSSYFIIGDYAQGNYGSPTGASFIVKAINDDPNSPLLKSPKDWSVVYTDEGSGGDYDWSIWAAVPHDGYVPIGMVGQLGYTRPDIQNYRCIRRDLVEQSSATTQIWNDEDSGADDDCTIWAVSNVPNVFVAQANYNAYSGTVYRLKGAD